MFSVVIYTPTQMENQAVLIATVVLLIIILCTQKRKSTEGALSADDEKKYMGNNCGKYFEANRTKSEKGDRCYCDADCANPKDLPLRCNLETVGSAAGADAGYCEAAGCREGGDCGWFEHCHYVDGKCGTDKPPSGECKSCVVM